MTVVRQDLNVNVPAAPPTRFWPNSTGFSIGTNVVGQLWTLEVDSPLYAAGQTADIAIQYMYNSSWVDIEPVTGFVLGPHSGKVVDSSGGVTFQTVSSNTINSDLGTFNGQNPTQARLQIDRISSGTISALTLSLTT